MSVRRLCVIVVSLIMSVCALIAIWYAITRYLFGSTGNVTNASRYGCAELTATTVTTGSIIDE